jgi:hypothetical protein
MEKTVKDIEEGNIIVNAINHSNWKGVVLHKHDPIDDGTNYYQYEIGTCMVYNEEKPHVLYSELLEREVVYICKDTIDLKQSNLLLVEA